MSVRNQRIEICQECGTTVSVSKNFKGKNVRCKDCRNVDHTHDTYEADEDDYFANRQYILEDPTDTIREDQLDLPPISSVVRLRDWVTRLDVRGSAVRLAHYDRSAQVAAAPQAAAATESISVASSLT